MAVRPENLEYIRKCVAKEGIKSSVKFIDENITEVIVLVIQTMLLQPDILSMDHKKLKKIWENKIPYTSKCSFYMYNQIKASFPPNVGVQKVFETCKPGDIVVYSVLINIPNSESFSVFKRNVFNPTV